MMSKICCFNKGNRCRILTVGKCVGTDCSFFKTPEEYGESLTKANTRIASLDKAVQKHIASTYFKGTYPWLEAVDANGC